MQVKEIPTTLVILQADEGKTFQRKADNEILGQVLYLGVHDSPNNYVEIEAPPEDISAEE